MNDMRLRTRTNVVFLVKEGSHGSVAWMSRVPHSALQTVDGRGSMEELVAGAPLSGRRVRSCLFLYIPLRLVSIVAGKLDRLIISFFAFFCLWQSVDPPSF